METVVRQAPLDLLTVVVQPTWKEILLDLVASKQMDPWDIDLVKVADAYVARVRQLQAMDLRVPANVILACSLMLRFKSETLSFEEPVEEEYYEEAPALLAENVPELVYRSNQPRKRNITLDELLQAVEQVVRDGPLPVVRVHAPRELSIDLPKENMNELMAHVYEHLHSLQDENGVVMFSDLMKQVNASPEMVSLGQQVLNQSAADPIARYLLPVLHLVQEQKVYCWQDEFFGEIFLKLMPQGGHPKGEKMVSVVPLPPAPNNN